MRTIREKSSTTMASWAPVIIRGATMAIRTATPSGRRRVFLTWEISKLEISLLLMILRLMSQTRLVTPIMSLLALLSKLIRLLWTSNSIPTPQKPLSPSMVVVSLALKCLDTGAYMRNADTVKGNRDDPQAIASSPSLSTPMASRLLCRTALTPSPMSSPMQILQIAPISVSAPWA